MIMPPRIFLLFLNLMKASYSSNRRPAFWMFLNGQWAIIKTELSQMGHDGKGYQGHSIVLSPKWCGTFGTYESQAEREEKCFLESADILVYYLQRPQAGTWIIPPCWKLQVHVLIGDNPLPLGSKNCYHCFPPPCRQPSIKLAKFYPQQPGKSFN